MVNKGFLLFELVYALAIIIAGVQAIFMLQASSLRTLGMIHQDKDKFLMGTMLLEQKARKEKTDSYPLKLSVEQSTMSVKIFIPHKEQRTYHVVSRSVGYLIVKDDKKILLVG